MKKLNRLAVIGCLTAILAGCSTNANQDENTMPDKLVLVQMPNENNPDAGGKHAEFSQALSEYIGIPVEELEGSDYTVGIEAMASKNVDVMLVSPMSYYQAKERAGAELLVSTPTSEDYRSAFIVKGDNDEIQNLEDLKGKTFAFVDQSSSSGYLYPKAHILKSLGLDSDQLEKSGYYFNTVAFSGQHQASLMGVVMQDYDGACVAASMIQMMIDAGAIQEGDVKVIDQSEIIPNPAYVIRGDLPEALKTKIKEFFLQYENEEYFETIHGNKDIRFVDVKEEAYEPAKEMLDALKIDFGSDE